VSSFRTADLEQLLERLRQGDEGARQELIAGSYERLRLLARRMLRRDFPRLERLHESTSVVHRCALRLLQALDKVRPAGVRDFFNLAARQMRWVLLDLSRQGIPAIKGLQAVGDDSSKSGRGEPVDRAEDADSLNAWASFHGKVADLPDEEREVFELLWYHGLTQAETAQLLKLHPREVSRRWLRARVKLIEAARQIECLYQERR
jgi:RNA polymerase sigma-70 factor (ECF subfamily)